MPPGEGRNRYRRVGRETTVGDAPHKRRLRNYVNAIWKKVSKLYHEALQNKEVFDIHAYAEMQLSYDKYLEVRAEQARVIQF